MQNIRLRRLAFMLAIITAALVLPARAQNYQLVWSDEFDGTTIDNTKWTFETGAGGWGNNEWEYYTNRTANAYVDSGRLVIKAIKESYAGSNYTSARMKTQGKISWKYGKIEARIKLPYGQGLWPAFWMLGDNISTVSWPKCGEIDIMEMIGSTGAGDRTTYGTAHWDNNGSHASYGLSKALASGRFADDYHIFSITWTSQKITWYLDNVQYCVIDITPTALAAAFQKNQFILLNLAVGGNWPGYPDGTTVFPQTMMVDYVRVYQDASVQPTVTLTSPANNAALGAGSDLVLTADPKPGTGTVAKVEFFQDAMKVGEAAASPYTVTLANAQPGTYRFTAKVTNSGGDAASSAVSAVTIGSGAPNSPYGAAAAAVPGTIEMENYNLGASGTAYSDADAGNTGSVYRSDAVDIESCSDTGGGYDVGWTAAGEWMLYTIDVKQSGTYRFNTRTASSAGGGSYHIEIDGTDVTGVIAAPSTGAWQTWTTSPSPVVTLNAGIHTMKFCVNASGFNVNKTSVALIATSVKERPQAPTIFALEQNYPNPFNPSTTIRYSVARAGDVTLEVFDILGTKVASLVNGRMEPGTYAAEWNARTQPSGMYLYRLRAGDFVAVKRLMLQK
jgi:beta-glucanase (GH16 family)